MAIPITMNMVGVLFRNFMERIALSLSLRVNLYSVELKASNQTMLAEGNRRG
jgi:hypothetical protein